MDNFFVLWSGVALCFVAFEFSTQAVAQTRTVAATATTPCGVTAACFPWPDPGNNGYPRPCNIGNKLNMRFIVDTAPESEICGRNFGPNTSNYVVYGFCPRVDELQAFNLTRSGSIATLFGKDWTANPSNFSNVSALKEGWLRSYGYGTSSDVLLPNTTDSDGAVMIAGNCPSDPTKIAIVPFLIMNLSLKNGRFVYYNNLKQPAGVGFSPSCTTDTGKDLCTLDSSMACIGRDGAKNCAQCYTEYDVDVLRNINFQIWVAYYGTDASGRPLRSGSDNPLNFRQYSGGNFYASMSTSLDNVKSGNFNLDPNNPGL